MNEQPTEINGEGQRLLPGAPGSALTSEMQKCLNEIGAGGGTITRYPGGFWYPSGDGKPSFGTTTVEALVKRGRLEYCECKESHGRKFPIKARIATVA